MAGLATRPVRRRSDGRLFRRRHFAPTVVVRFPELPHRRSDRRCSAGAPHRAVSAGHSLRGAGRAVRPPDVWVRALSALRVRRPWVRKAVHLHRAHRVRRRTGRLSDRFNWSDLLSRTGQHPFPNRSTVNFGTGVFSATFAGTLRPQALTFRAAMRAASRERPRAPPDSRFDSASVTVPFYMLE